MKTRAKVKAFFRVSIGTDEMRFDAHWKSNWSKIHTACNILKVNPSHLFFASPCPSEPCCNKHGYSDALEETPGYSEWKEVSNQCRWIFRGWVKRLHTFLDLFCRMAHKNKTLEAGQHCTMCQTTWKDQYQICTSQAQIFLIDTQRPSCASRFPFPVWSRHSNRASMLF